MTDTAQRGQILDALFTRGWDLATAEDGAWWADEVVALRSALSPVGTELVLTFLVDPQHDGPRMKGEHVWALVASKQRLTDRAAAERSGPLLPLGRGWQARLSDFLDAVEKMTRERQLRLTRRALAVGCKLPGMGAWGHGSFENDGACDWIAELEADGIEAIREALQPRAHEYIEVDDASNAIAAAEIVAAARGHGADDLPEEVSAWLEANASSITDDDVALARKVVARVREGSELQELWAENGPENEWERGTASLLKRLARSAT